VRGSDATMELFRVEAERAPGRNCGLGGLSRKNRNQAYTVAMEIAGLAKIVFDPFPGDDP